MTFIQITIPLCETAPRVKALTFRPAIKSASPNGWTIWRGFIEGGWPGRTQDVEFFERAQDIEWKNAKLAAFGSTCRVKGAPKMTQHQGAD